MIRSPIKPGSRTPRATPLTRARWGGAVTYPAAPSYTMTQLAAANRVYQRTARTGGAPGKGTGTINVSLTLAGSAALVEFRRRSAADGVTIRQGWTNSGAGAVASGSQVVSLAGVEAQAGWDYIDIRLNKDDSSIKTGTTPVAVGMLGLLSGQSLMVRNFSPQEDPTTTIAAAGVTATPNGVSFAAVETGDGTTPSAWLAPTDAQAFNKGAGAAELMAKLHAASGVNVGIVAKTQGATSITQWLPGTTYGDALIATADAAGGAFEFVWWYQGHNDVGMALPTYRTHLNTLFAAINAHNSFSGAVNLISSVPNAAGSWNPEAMRRNSHEWALSKGYTPLAFNDIEMATDKTHPIQIGGKRQARHAYRALRPSLGYSNDHRGATLGTATHAAGSSAIVIPFTLKPGATQLVTAGDPSLRFFVFPFGRRTGQLAYAASNKFVVDNVAKTITLNLAADPGQVSLEVVQSISDDDSTDGSANNVWDDATDGDGITTGRLLDFGPRSKRVWVPANLTLTSAAYGTGKFGQSMSGGYGSTAFNVIPSVKFGFTISMWVNVTASGGLSVLMGLAGSDWIAASGFDLKVTLNGSTQTFTGALSLGLHHIAVEVIGGSYIATAYVDGAVVGSSWSTGGYANGGITSIRHLGGGFVPTTYNVDEVAVFEGPIYGGAFTPPSAPYSGTETNLVALWHLNGNGTDSATPAS